MHRTETTRLLTLLIAAFAATGLRAGEAPPAAQRGAIVGNIIDPALREVSGMAASRRRSDVLWVVNDSGNAPELFAVSTNGTVLTRHPVAGVKNRDWEDLASFVHEDVPYLVIAEVGDNQAKHGTCTLHFVVEPEIPVDARDPGPPLPVIRQTRFRYEDGPRDCESVVVDVADQRVLLLSKRDQPPVLYALPLDPAENGKVITARRLGELTTLPRPTADDLRDPFGKHWAQPTAMDLEPDGRRLVVLTYKNAYLYERDAGQPWIKALTRSPQVILLPYPGTEIMRKREAICFSHDAASVFVTSEGQPSPLFRLDGLEPAPQNLR